MNIHDFEQEVVDYHQNHYIDLNGTGELKITNGDLDIIQCAAARIKISADAIIEKLGEKDISEFALSILSSQILVNLILISNKCGHSIEDLSDYSFF